MIFWAYLKHFSKKVQSWPTLYWRLAVHRARRVTGHGGTAAVPTMPRTRKFASRSELSESTCWRSNDALHSEVRFASRSELSEARRAERSQSHATYYRWTSRELQAAKRPATRGPKGREEPVACHVLPLHVPWITSREAACDSRPEGPRGASRLPLSGH